MPKVLIKESSFDQLQNDLTYTIILNKNAFVLNQIPNKGSSEKIFSTKIDPSQIKQLQLIEKDKDLSLFLEFTAPDNQIYSFIMTSIELPINNLYDDMMNIIQPTNGKKVPSSEEKPSDENVNETQTQDPFAVAFNEFITKAQSVVTPPFIQGIKMIQLRMQGLGDSIISGFQSISKSFFKPESKQESSVPLEKDSSLPEFMIPVNNLYLNHFDSALTVDPNASIDANQSLKMEDSQEILAALNKRTAVLLHPFGLDMTIWRPYIDYFNQKNYRVIAFDMRGWGNSAQSTNDSYKFTDYYSDLMTILEVKKLLEKENDLVLLTASITGLMLLNKIDERLYRRKHLKLVLLSSSDHITEDIQNLIKKMPPPKLWGPLKRFGRGKIKDYILTKEIETESQDEIISKLISSNNKVIFETVKNLSEKEYVEGLSEEQLKLFPFEKTLVIMGEKDLFVSFENINHLKNVKKVTIRVIEKGNHFIAFEKPELILKEINDWL